MTDLEQATEELGVAVSELTVVTKKLKEATEEAEEGDEYYDLETAQFHLNEYERKHHWGEVQKHYEEEEELETDTAHEIATEDLNQDSFYCQWRVVKENMETNPIKAYFALEKMHGDHGDCDAASDYDTNLGLEDGTGAKTPTSELDDAHLGVYKDYRIVEHYLLSQCPPGTKQALEWYQGFIRHMKKGFEEMKKDSKYGDVFSPDAVIQITLPKNPLAMTSSKL
jgi:hypothetical protein